MPRGGRRPMDSELLHMQFGFDTSYKSYILKINYFIYYYYFAGSVEFVLLLFFIKYFQTLISRCSLQLKQQQDSIYKFYVLSCCTIAIQTALRISKAILAIKQQLNSSEIIFGSIKLLHCGCDSTFNFQVLFQLQTSY